MMMSLKRLKMRRKLTPFSIFLHQTRPPVVRFWTTAYAMSRSGHGANIVSRAEVNSLATTLIRKRREERQS